MTRFADLRGAGRRGRRIVLVLAVPLVLATLPAIAGAEEDGSAAMVVTDHRAAVESARATAAAWNLDDAVAKVRDKALEHLDKALDPGRWLADGSGVTDDKVFDGMEKAAKELAKISAPDAAWVVAGLVGVAEDLAAEAIAAAGAGGADVEKAQKAFDEAGAEEKNEKRIDKYAKAWKEAGKAVEKAAKASGGGGSGTFGDSHVYDFTMVAADGVTSFVVHGTSGSNEGYLFHPGFGPDDTYMDEAARAAVIAEAVAAGVPGAAGLDAASGGVIQVHVSCSDAFPDGFGAKSDPAVTAAWRVQSAHIVKGDKTCDVSGVGTPVPTSLGDTIPGSSCFDAGYPAADGVFYEFVFIPAAPTFLEDGSVSSAETLTVCGQSDGNEGFLYDDAFDPGDTYTEIDGQMQVHVSCSDAFAGGIGQKSDPTAGSQWLVNTAHIVKVDNGEVKKDCEVIGSGLPIGDPPPTIPRRTIPRPTIPRRTIPLRTIRLRTIRLRTIPRWAPRPSTWRSGSCSPSATCSRAGPMPTTTTRSSGPSPGRTCSSSSR
jgi:hypothetical protein